MSLLLSALSWAGPCQVLLVAGAGLVSVVTVWTARLLLQHARFTQRLSCFSKPHADSWLIGHLGQMQSTEEGLLQVDELVRTHKHSCSWFLGPFYHLVRLFHPDFTKPLLLAPAGITLKDELIYGHLRPWLGQSLLLSNGEAWARRRRLLTPAFHFDILRNYVATFNTSADTMHEKWRRLAAEGRTTVEIFDHVTLMTLDSLLKCAFSYSSNCQESRSEYVSAIVELGDLLIERRQNILHHWDWVYWQTRQGKRFRRALNVVHSFTREVVQRRRALINRSDSTSAPPGKRDFVDIILLSKDGDGRGLADEEIEAEANTFMFAGEARKSTTRHNRPRAPSFAGHDTTASAICWTLYNLARHPHFQDKCRREVLELMGGHQHQGIEWDDLANLPFTTMCIKEALRLHSPVQAVTRTYTQDMPLPGNRTVPKGEATLVTNSELFLVLLHLLPPPGAICLVSIYGTHHNPDVWTDPHEFRPQRFEGVSHESRSSHAFIPFSSGPRCCFVKISSAPFYARVVTRCVCRNCIGQKFALAELRVVVALTLHRFRLSTGVNPKSGSEEVRRLPQLVLRAEGGLWLQLEPLSPADMEAAHSA
ncbi:cytochrome P450 4F3 isoform X3 [Dunckerocampus dactyliophorus]|nr:cytochrome P450 4F3 isoform X3 [Dunckerocampus dactyliophorus]XP_054630482.1 cytochrome P450 4F3 isoform X3 [Dunckerocampus dactyliophorus]